MRAPRSFSAHRCQADGIQAVGQTIARVKPANRFQEDIHALERYRGLPAALKRSVELREQGVAVPPLDHGRLQGMVLLAVARKWVSKDDQSTFRADRKAHIRQWGSCAPKTLFDVHGCASLCCWLRCGSGPAVVPAVPVRGHRRWTGAPPGFGLPGSAVRGGLMCTTHATPVGVAPIVSVLAGRQAVEHIIDDARNIND